MTEYAKILFDAQFDFNEMRMIENFRWVGDEARALISKVWFGSYLGMDISRLQVGETIRLTDDIEVEIVATSHGDDNDMLVVERI